MKLHFFTIPALDGSASEAELNAFLAGHRVAAVERVPVYAVFTNEQLAEMVTSRAATLEAIGGIAGVGEARLGKYGAAVLEVLTEAHASRGGDNAPAPAP